MWLLSVGLSLKFQYRHNNIFGDKRDINVDDNRDKNKDNNSRINGDNNRGNNGDNKEDICDSSDPTQR